MTKRLKKINHGVESQKKDFRRQVQVSKLEGKFNDLFKDELGSMSVMLGITGEKLREGNFTGKEKDDLLAYLAQVSGKAEELAKHL